MDQIMNLNHSRIPLNTPKKFHQNRSSRLEGVQLQTHSQKNYIYKDIYIYITHLCDRFLFCKRDLVTSEKIKLVRSNKISNGMIGKEAGNG